MIHKHHFFLFFFFNDTATTEIYTLSLHDALPISANSVVWNCETKEIDAKGPDIAPNVISTSGEPRSEEHTSELQSQSNLVCRLLLEKKKKKYHSPGTDYATLVSGHIRCRHRSTGH